MNDYYEKSTIQESTSCGGQCVIAIPLDRLSEEELAELEPVNDRDKDSRYIVGFDCGSGYEQWCYAEKLTGVKDALDAWSGIADAEFLPEGWHEINSNHATKGEILSYLDTYEDGKGTYCWITETYEDALLERFHKSREAKRLEKRRQEKQYC